MAPEYWQVRIALEDDWDVVRRALFVVVPAERWSINLKGGDEVETATLVLDVLAESHGEAEDEAERLYTSARREAGLPERSPMMIGVRTHRSSAPSVTSDYSKSRDVSSRRTVTSSRLSARRRPASCSLASPWTN